NRPGRPVSRPVTPPRRRAVDRPTVTCAGSMSDDDNTRMAARRRTFHPMSAEDLEKYETEMELSLYREYKDIVGQFSYVVETERRFYLANSVELRPQNADGEVYFEVRMSDAWVWDMYRPARFVKHVRVIT